MPARWSRGSALLCWGAFAALATAIFWGALGGPFVSDDIGYIVNSPYTSDLSAASLRAVFDPWGDARLYTANYAPLHLLATALERQIFADDVVGYHLVNILVHALNATLLVGLLIASGLAATPALLAGLIFVVHPANVEAVAWISQLKTSGSLALSLGALLALRRHPGWGALLFGAALLTKASAAFALPTAAAFAWARRADRSTWVWLGVWALLFALYAVPQFSSFGQRGAVEVPAYADGMVQLRSIAAVGSRYLVMAASSWGVSAFAEPAPAISLLDPWWLAALPAGALLGWRAVATLRRRSEEGAYWVAAAASFAPVSQLFPFLNPVADRYLYFILPGLLGGTLFALRDLRDAIVRALAARGRTAPSAETLGRAATAAAVALCIFFGLHAARRAPLWTNETRLHLDAARNYPEGGTAAFLSARRAAQEGNAAAAVALLRRASNQGIDAYAVVLNDPGLGPIRNDPAFRALVHDLAGRVIERARVRSHSTQPDLRAVAYAHVQREEYADAERELRRALEVGGPLDEVIRSEIAEVARLRADARSAVEEVGDRPLEP